MPLRPVFEAIIVLWSPIPHPSARRVARTLVLSLSVSLSLRTVTLFLRRPGVGCALLEGVPGGPAAMAGQLGGRGGGKERRNGLSLEARRGDGGDQALPTGGIVGDVVVARWLAMLLAACPA